MIDAAQNYRIHRHDISIECQPARYREALHETLGSLSAENISTDSALHGTVAVYDAREVAARLSPTASHIRLPGESFELYQDQNLFWMIDDRWGMCELNLLKSTWKSWTLPQVSLDANALIEQAVMWPMAQLLVLRGLHLMPAAGIVCDGAGTLILSRETIEPQLRALVAGGCGLVGQRWIALRESCGRVEMLAMPCPIPMQHALHAPSQWIDLAQNASNRARGSCDAVLIVDSQRTSIGKLNRLSPMRTLPELRRAWPIAQLHPQRREGRLIHRLAETCNVFATNFSRDADAVVGMIDQLRGMRKRVVKDNDEERAAA